MVPAVPPAFPDNNVSPVLVVKVAVPVFNEMLPVPALSVPVTVNALFALVRLNNPFEVVNAPRFAMLLPLVRTTLPLLVLPVKVCAAIVVAAFCVMVLPLPETVADKTPLTLDVPNTKLPALTTVALAVPPEILKLIGLAEVEVKLLVALAKLIAPPPVEVKAVPPFPMVMT